MTLKAKIAIISYLAEIGRKGGKKSRRKLTPEQAKAMVAAREKKRKGLVPHKLENNL